MWFWGCHSGTVAGCGSRAVTGHNCRDMSGCVAWIVLAVLSVKMSERCNFLIPGLLLGALL